MDIVLNELDALVNIDFKTGEEKVNKSSLNFIRIGTSGAIQPDISVDSFLLTETAIGLDGLMHFYETKDFQDQAFLNKLLAHFNWKSQNVIPYVFDCNAELAQSLKSNRIRFGTTVTNAGFYAPQGRNIRLSPKLKDFHQKLSSFNYQDKKITNLEMETAGIYGLSELLGHSAVSMSAILANRATGEFSGNPSKTIHKLIEYCLERLT